MNDENVEFGFVRDSNNIIKIVGVGGGGGNAVTNMYEKGIKDVDFLVFNTDRQDLEKSTVPVKLQLGKTGLGAGNVPEVARVAAEETIDEMREALSGAKMVFITAGLGGGTGTGATPVVARTAKEMGILTVAIVTIPFLWEGRQKILKALKSISEIKKNVDALLIINNERLLDIYKELDVFSAFSYADDVLGNAAKGISEIVTINGKINVDFADVNTTMRDGGVAIMNVGYASGESRVTKAIENALDSPLLNNNDIRSAKRILLVLYCSEEYKLMISEMSELNEFMAQMTEDEIDVKWGITIDNSLGEQLKITIVATGFGVQGVLDAVDEESISGLSDETSNDMVKSELEMEREDVAIDSYYGDGRRVSIAPKLNSRTQSAKSEEEIIEEPAVVIFTNDEDEDEDIPAYKRKSKLNEESNFSSFSSSTSGFSLDDDGNVSDKNKFLFDNVD